MCWPTSQDKPGWEKARETLGDKCLLIAEHTLEDQLSKPPKSQESPSQPQEENMSHTGNDVSPAPKLPLLSCGTLSPRDKVLSGLFAEAGRLRGEFKLCGRVIKSCCQGHPSGQTFQCFIRSMNSVD